MTWVGIVFGMVVVQFPTPKFEHQTLDDKISIGYGVAIGDVDGDGKPDVLLADQKQFVWYRNGDWKKFVLAENLTERDNVCLAARDIDGDGKVEIAVGAQWNPGETNDPAKSGAIFYLVRPADPTQQWEAVRVEPHEVTTHRMRWVRVDEKRFQLVVVPLHGRGNKDGQGAPVKILAYEKPADPKAPWKTSLVDESLHITHNFDVIPGKRSEELGIVGREGLVRAEWRDAAWKPKPVTGVRSDTGAGEVRVGSLGEETFLVATVEPWHGHELVAYTLAVHGNWKRVIVDNTFKEAHALSCADLLGIGRDQIVVGWRNPDFDKKVGIKLFTPRNDVGDAWNLTIIDDNQMACEDLAVADLDGDGKPDIAASGRRTKNVKIYWNRTEKK
jgi:hypothetical protein